MGLICGWNRNFVKYAPNTQDKRSYSLAQRTYLKTSV